jgi:hypothetical protein
MDVPKMIRAAKNQIVLDGPERGGSTEPVDHGDIGRMLLRLEAIRHKKGGWDPQIPELLMLARSDCVELEQATEWFEFNGPIIRCGPLTAVSVMHPIMLQGHPDPVDLLDSYAVGMACADIPGFPHQGQRKAYKFQRSMIRLKGVVGFALVAESWANSDPDVPTDKSLGDIVGSVELRFVLFRDLAGGVYHLAIRVRGQEPSLEHDPPGGEGALHEILQLLCETTLGRQPTSRQEFLDRYRGADV